MCGRAVDVPISAANMSSLTADGSWLLRLYGRAQFRLVTPSPMFNFLSSKLLSLPTAMYPTATYASTSNPSGARWHTTRHWRTAASTLAPSIARPIPRWPRSCRSEATHRCDCKARPEYGIGQSRRGSQRLVTIGRGGWRCSYRGGKYHGYINARRTVDALQEYLERDPLTFWSAQRMPTRSPFWYTWQIRLNNRLRAWLVRQGERARSMLRSAQRTHNSGR